jgi:hypothetical protein
MIKEHIGPVYLEPIQHVYIHRKTGVKYQSVTKVITSVEPHFDSESVSLAIVKQSNDVKQERYIGMNQGQILEYWQMLNDEANEYGTHVHDTIEKYLKANKWWFPTDDLQQKIISGYEDLKIEEGICMQPERIMFSEYYELAGMSDLIIDIDDVWFDVGDWKTNRVFNFYNPFGFQTLLKPFTHMQASQFSIYNLQLSVYATMYMMEFPNKKCRQMWIAHWDKDTYKFTKINMPFLKHEAKQLMELHKINMMK